MDGKAHRNAPQDSQSEVGYEREHGKVSFERAQSEVGFGREQSEVSFVFRAGTEWNRFWAGCFVPQNGDLTRRLLVSEREMRARSIAVRNKNFV